MNIDTIRFTAPGKFIRRLVEAVEFLPDGTLPDKLVFGGRLRADTAQPNYCQISLQENKDRFRFEDVKIPEGAKNVIDSQGEAQFDYKGIHYVLAGRGKPMLLPPFITSDQYSIKGAIK